MIGKKDFKRDGKMDEERRTGKLIRKKDLKRKLKRRKGSGIRKTDGKRIGLERRKVSSSKHWCCFR